MIRILFATMLLICSTGAAAQSLALSFDDGFNPSTNPQAEEWNGAILDALADAEVKAIFFVTGSRVNSPEGMTLVRAWGKAGHAIANHSYAHSNFGSPNVSLRAFIEDAARNEELLREKPGWTTRDRFPFLKEGDTAVKRDGFRAWLSDHDYAPGAVSIDASDWYYNSRYLDWIAANPNKDVSAYRDAYLTHLLDRAVYYDDLANETLGRSVDHVLLLHTNAINAHFVADIVNMFRANGWEIISPEEAYADPVYQKEPDVLPAGESIVWALAKERGIKGLRYPAEDGRYEKKTLDLLEAEMESR